MSYYPDDTICAIATAGGGGARGIVRISGSAAVDISGRLIEPATGVRVKDIGRPTALPCHIQIALGGHASAVPCDLFAWPCNRSYTREPVVELHTIGSRPILEAVQNALCHAGARLAQTGEFTLRAFLAGRLDLTQAEAVLGVIDAQSGSDLSAALCQLAGGLARPLHQLRDDLLQLLAELEAGLDFVEEDIEFVSSAEVLNRLQSANHLLETVEAQLTGRHAASYLPQIALVGPPNAGKSSLFNAFVEEYGAKRLDSQHASYSALVSPERGTTRDYLANRILVDGVACELIDTAGVESDVENSTPSAIQTAAEALSAERRNAAAIVAYCVESTAIAPSGDLTRFDLPQNCDVLVVTKSDLDSSAFDKPLLRPNMPTVVTSSRTKTGLDKLRQTFGELLRRSGKQNIGSAVAATADRCRESVRLARQSVKSASQIVATGGGDEIVASELRESLLELGKVVGTVYTDDLLDRIFSQFCIGK